MTQSKRMSGDQISINHPSRTRTVGKVLLSVACLIVLSACQKDAPKTSNSPDVKPAPSTGLDAAGIIQRNLALDTSRDSTMRLRARITADAESRDIELTMYRKRQTDGRLLTLIEFTAPPEERDRDGLTTVFPDSQIELVRYIQSTESYVVVSDATSEDALFGLTPQELAGGQPEKYEFDLAGEESYEGTPVYRLEGRLKQGAESKFFRAVLMISKQDFNIARAEFYDNHDALARLLTVGKNERVGGYWTRIRWRIDNRGRQRKIDFEVVDVKYDQNLRDAIFTREHLKKIASR